MKLEFSLEKKLGNFSLHAEASAIGERIGVFGPSGSGKSTLMQLLAGLETPDAGYFRLNDETLYDSYSAKNVAANHRRVGIVFQHAHLFPHMGVRKNLLYGYHRIPKQERQIDPDAIIEVLSLSQLLERDVRSLSGGERQRVALGRTVLSCPRLILMDEPLTGLDATLKYQIIPYLNQVVTEFKIPLIFISHSLSEMRLMTEQVLEMSCGMVTNQTSAHQLALERMGRGLDHYTNLLELPNPRFRDGLSVYRWGEQELVLTDGNGKEGMFEIPAKDITLFKRHPEASSARNMLHCNVQSIFTAGPRVGVELECGGRTIVSQIVGEAVRELDLKVGSPVYAAIKASSFRLVY